MWGRKCKKKKKEKRIYRHHPCLCTGRIRTHTRVPDATEKGEKRRVILFHFFPLSSCDRCQSVCVRASDWGVETRWRPCRADADRVARGLNAHAERRRVAVPPNSSSLHRAPTTTATIHPLTNRSHNPPPTFLPITTHHTYLPNSIVTFGNTTGRNMTRLLYQYIT